MTRPKPTIYGNCDSWSFIVGKKPGAYSQSEGLKTSLQANNRNFIHNLSTISKHSLWDNMWANCESAVHPPKTSRIVVRARGDMPPKRMGDTDSIQNCK